MIRRETICIVAGTVAAAEWVCYKQVCEQWRSPRGTLASDTATPTTTTTIIITIILAQFQPTGGPARPPPP